MRRSILSVGVVCVVAGLTIFACGGCSQGQGRSEKNDEQYSAESVESDKPYEESYEVSEATNEVAEEESDEIAEKMKIESAKKFVMDMYATVLPAASRGDGDKYISRFCDENFAGWIKYVDEHDAKSHSGEIGFRDCEFWTRSQDPGSDIKPTIERAWLFKDFNDNEFVQVIVSLRNGNYAPREVLVRLFHFEEGWKVTDYDGMLMDMKSYIIDEG